MTKSWLALVLASTLLAGCASSPVKVHLWDPDSPVLPLLTRPGGEGAANNDTSSETAGPKLNQYVVLLPDEDGEVGIIEVSDGETVARLDQAYQAVRFDNLGETYFAERPQEEAPDFQAARIHEPPAPTQHYAYFELDSTALNNSANAAIQTALADVLGRAAPQVRVVGHADSVGSEEKNSQLSRRRAEAVAALLQQGGVATESIVIRWHGETLPAVATADGVREPRNRRVVIKIR